MRASVILVFFIAISMSCFPQKSGISIYERHQRDLVKDFYRLLFKDSTTISDFAKVYVLADEEKRASPFKVRINKIENSIPGNITSVLMQKIKREYYNELTDNLRLETILQLVDRADMYNDGYLFGVILELRLPTQYSIYFEIDSDIPGLIERIYKRDAIALCSSGSDTYVEQLFRPGMINDKDGYTNIRKEQSQNSQVVYKMKRNDLFFYSPIGGSDWYPISKDDGGKIIGFIHKSRIIKYQSFTKTMKEKVERIRGGC